MKTMHGKQLGLEGIMQVLTETEGGITTQGVEYLQECGKELDRLQTQEVGPLPFPCGGAVPTWRTRGTVQAFKVEHVLRCSSGFVAAGEGCMVAMSNYVFPSIPIEDIDRELLDGPSAGLPSPPKPEDWVGLYLCVSDMILYTEASFLDRYEPTEGS